MYFKNILATNFKKLNIHMKFLFKLANRKSEKKSLIETSELSVVNSGRSSDYSNAIICCLISQASIQVISMEYILTVVHGIYSPEEW